MENSSLLKSEGCFPKSTFTNYLANFIKKNWLGQIPTGPICSAGLAVKDVRRFFAPLFPSSLLPPSKYLETLQLNSTVQISRLIFTIYLSCNQVFLARIFKSPRVIFPPF